MNKERIAIISIIIMFVGVTLIAAHFGKRHNHYLDMEFSGTVLDVDYDIKNMPTVNIDGTSYFIGHPYYFDGQIENGDSLIKKKESNCFRIDKEKVWKEALLFGID